MPLSTEPVRTSPAFKEWQVIVEALGSGEQSLILRKGGISEGPGGFDPARAGLFWLFPTRFHAQHEKTKPDAITRFAPGNTPVDPGNIALCYFAKVVRTAFLDRWEDVARLDPFHFWAETAIREKFNWGEPPGLHAIMVRVYRLHAPLVLPVTPAMAGCRSWIDLPCPLEPDAGEPVLPDTPFNSLEALLAQTTPALFR